MSTKTRITYERVGTLERLLYHIRRGDTDFFIHLNGGARSSKGITIGEPRGKEETLNIENYIDDTFETLTHKELWTKSNIGRAMDVGALYVEIGV